MLIMRLLRTLARFLLLFVGSVETHGLEHVPAEGPYIVAVNHMSKADPPLLLIVLPTNKLRFFAAEKWEHHLLFGPMMKWAGAIYINRGEVDRAALRQALAALREGSVFGLAPEGTRSRVGALIRARDGAAYLATRSGVPILPAGIVNSDAIGQNLVRLRRTRLEVNFGRPFTVPDIGRRPRGSDLSAYTHLIMIHIAALIPASQRGYYADSPALLALLGGEDPWPLCLEAEGASLETEDQADLTVEDTNLA